MKSEPSCYSIDDLKREGIGMWDGVRNYQARNFIRDDMKQGDQVLFYHSNTHPIGVVGVAEVVGESYPDPTQFNSNANHFDPKASTAHPRWFVVDVRFKQKFEEPVTLGELKNDPFFSDMIVVRTGVRLSVQPVVEKHFIQIIHLRHA